MSPPAADGRLSTLALALLGTWGKPVDRPAAWALAVAAVLALLACVPPSIREAAGFPAHLPRAAHLQRRLLMVLAFGAAFLSLGYVAVYLRAGPRIIDATSYFLEGRVLSHGHLSWPVALPTSASFRGRFLLLHDGELSVIFPPGYPLLLALGFLVRAPLVIGPLLGGALVLLTYALARELAYACPEDERRAIATLAAALSVVCVALRYHTADTMAHGASAVGVTLALTLAFKGARTGKRLPWLGAGLALGWVVCTRPVSSFAIGGVLLFLAARARPRRVVELLVGLLPGAIFLVVASHAQTGRWLVPAQSAYYAASDGPEGCFRYGFGTGVGCLLEHKDFVAARLPDGYGVVAALLTTLRRLRAHLLDVANLEPLALLVLVPLRRRPSGGDGARDPRALATLAVVAGQILAYVPFYFDGDYPGGGARFFADVLPLEHALLALAAASVLPRLSLFRRSAAVLALALAGFAVHGAFEHKSLSTRDGGRPLFDPEETRSITTGLMFFDTDHGFNLAYDPFVEPKKGMLAARLRGDDHDRLLVERLDHPPAHVYKLDASGGRPAVASWGAKLGASKDLWRFEAEADWPPLTQGGGWAEPVWVSTSCASEGRVLTLHPDDVRVPAHVSIELPTPRPGRWTVQPRVLFRGGQGRGRLELVQRRRTPVPGEPRLVWEWRDDDGGARTGTQGVCLDLPPKDTAGGLELDLAGATWELTATGGDVSLDQTTLRTAR